MPGPWEKYQQPPAPPPGQQPGAQPPSQAPASAPQGPWGQFGSTGPGGPTEPPGGPPGAPDGGFEPGSFGDYLEALQQGAVLDPVEKIGGMAENLPGALGRGARAVGNMIPGSVQRFLDQNRAAGERHPWVRMAGNVAPWMLAGPEGVAGDLLVGGAAGALQPLDPNDPNFWRHTATQATGGAAMGGAVGAALRGIGGAVAGQTAAKRLAEHQANLAAKTKAYNAAVDKLNEAREGRFETETARVKAINDRIAEVNAAARARFEAATAARRDNAWQNEVAEHRERQERAAIPEQTTREFYQRVYAEAGMPGLAPQTINYRTAALVRQDIGSRLGGIFQRMHVSGTDPALHQRLLSIIQSTNHQLAGSSAAMQNLWRTTVGQKLIYPFLRRPDMTGEELGNFMSALKREATERGLAAQSGTEDPRAQRLVAHGLRDMIDAIENQADRLNPALGRQRRMLNRAYTLTNIGGEATPADTNGVFTPSQLLRAWERHDGFWRFGQDARMGRLKSQLQDRVRQMETPARQPGPPPLHPPGHIPREAQPARPGRWSRVGPPAPAAASSAPSAGSEAAGHALVHALHTMAGVPRVVGRALVGPVRAGTQAAARAAARHPGQAAALAGATAGQLVTPDIILPPVTITAPAPWLQRQGRGAQPGDVTQ